VFRSREFRWDQHRFLLEIQLEMLAGHHVFIDCPNYESQLEYSALASQVVMAHQLVSQLSGVF